MKIVAPPIHPLRCDSCGMHRQYVVEIDEDEAMIWLCPYCVEQAWKLIETHEEALLAREKEARHA